VASLGLEHNFVTSKTLASIQQLPEVKSALANFPSLSSVDDLKRASQIFDSFPAGAAASEQLAVRALLAECQQRLALYDKALASLDRLAGLIQTLKMSTSTNKDDPSLWFLQRDDIILARAKILWTMGEFREAQQLCESIIHQYDDLQESFPTTTNLHLASAMTGKGISQLAAMATMDDAYSVRDYFRIAVRFLERHPSSSGPTTVLKNLPEAAVLNNSAVAEAIYAIFLEQTNGVSMPFTVALKTWFKALQKLKGGTITDNRDVPSQILQAKIQTNLAWGILNYEQDQSDRLSKASDYAGKALKVYDTLRANENSNTSSTPQALVPSDGLTRTLSILGSCFHQSDNAVTAEGLFQSAVDKKKHLLRAPDTLSLLELKAAYRGYADLCHKWEKREGDVRRLEGGIRQVDEELLPPGWNGKSDVFSGMWFWTPGDVHSNHHG
jgi:tetratricopeptide (TPR) repeat protein